MDAPAAKADTPHWPGRSRAAGMREASGAQPGVGCAKCLVHGQEEVDAKVKRLLQPRCMQNAVSCRLHDIAFDWC
ncbi:hypothetical protein PSAC2689_30052 [Paraburkholderia sacchari]